MTSHGDGSEINAKWLRKKNGKNICLITSLYLSFVSFSLEKKTWVVHLYKNSSAFFLICFKILAVKLMSNYLTNLLSEFSVSPKPCAKFRSYISCNGEVLHKWQLGICNLVIYWKLLPSCKESGYLVKNKKMIIQ